MDAIGNKTFDHVAKRDTVTFLLQFNAEHVNFSNMSMSSDTGGMYMPGPRVLMRSKRFDFWKATQNYLCSNVIDIAKRGVKWLVNEPNSSIVYTFLEIGDWVLDCPDTPYVDLETRIGDEFHKISDKLGDVSGQVAKAYWAIGEISGALSVTQGLLQASQALLLVNTGLLIGFAFMVWNISSKLDRNYEAILRLEGKIDRNYEAILRTEGKVDRNLEVMLSSFKILEYNLTNVLERGFKQVIDFVRQTRIEGVTSELITFIRHFMQEKDSLRNLTHDQYVTKLEEVNGILQRLQNSRMPQSGSLHTLLYNIINQRFAVPENSNDKVALTALGLLCAGTETYTSVMFLLHEEYNYLADFYYHENDLEKYNHYFSIASTTYNDFKNSLAGNDGLINEVINLLNQVTSYDFIKDEREDVIEFASKTIDSLNLVKSKLGTINNLSQEKPTEKIKYNFSSSQVKTPIGNWEDRRKVSYAIQFRSNGTKYQVGEWSTPARIHRTANPLLDIGTDLSGRTRLIFRKFDTDKPELVGIVEDSNQKEFRDVNRDLYNAILEPNQEIAMDEIKVFLANGADINARYEIGRQAIHAAAESGNSNVLLTLINKGADINAKDENGYAPIHVAAGVGYENVVMQMVNSGANVNAKTNLDETALHVASAKGHVNTVKNLMQIEGIDINAKNRRGYTPLHVAASFGRNNVITSLSEDNRTKMNVRSEVGFTPLHLAAIGEYSDAVKALMASDRVDINAKTQSGLTALHFASLIGNLNIAKRIIRNNEVNINEKTADGWTSLHLAINSKQESVVLELLSTHNIEINAKGKDDLTALHLAASSGQKSIVSELLDKGASIEDVDKYGCTPLHFAIESVDLDVVKFLVEKGANLYAERKDGYTPLGLASFNGRLNIVQFLVNDKKVNVNTKNKNGMTPIDFAASNGFYNIVEFLIDNGANKEFALHWAAYGGQLNIVKYLADEKYFDLNKKDKYGNIPLHSAALRGHLHIIKYFVDEKQISLNRNNNDGYSPFLFAVLGGYLDVIKYFIDAKRIDLTSSYNKYDNNGNTALHLATLTSNLGVIKYLIRKGIDVKAIDNYGNTPLFLATSRGHLDMVKYLIQKGAGFERTNNYGNTPLHFAAWNGHLDIVKYFIEKGVNFNTINKNGDTPLHVSVSVDIMKYLIQKGANLRAINNDGCMPLHVAASNGNLEIIKYLLEQGIDINTKVVKSHDKTNNGKTALHLAAQNGKLDIVEYLLYEGADSSSRDDSGKTSRDLAEQNGHTDLVKFLEEVQLNLNLLNAVKQDNFSKVKEYVGQGASFKVQDKNGDTIQEIAIRNGNFEIMKFLKQAELDSNVVSAVKQGDLDMIKEYIAKGASLEAEDKDGKSLLYLAAQNKDIVLFLKQVHRLNLGLHVAVVKRNFDSVKEYVSRGASLEAKNLGRTPLYIAANYGSLNIVRYLIEKGADVNASDDDGFTPLHQIARHGNLDIVQKLVEKGADINAKSKDGTTVLHMAAKSGNLDVVNYFVGKGADFNIKTETLLHNAVLGGNLDVVKYFVEKGAGINTSDKDGESPLHDAAYHGKLDIVKYLVEKGANINASDKFGETPLYEAASRNQLDIVKYLAEKGADVNASGKYGYTPLHEVASHGNLDAVQDLVEKGANVNAESENGITILHMAACGGNLSVVKYFVEKGGNVNAESKDGFVYRAADSCRSDPEGGFTVLHMAAAFRGNLDVVKYLVEKGVDINAKSSGGKTPLHTAAYYGKLDVVKYLVEKGADVNVSDKDGETPLYKAAYMIKLDVVKYLAEKGADVNASDKYGHTPLHKLASGGKLDAVQDLVEKGANVNAESKNGITVLHMAACGRNLSVVKYFVEKGANVNAKSKDGTTSFLGSACGGKLKGGLTVLHMAAAYGNLDIVKYLINEGANINAQDDNNKTPLEFALEHGNLAIADFLQNGEDQVTSGAGKTSSWLIGLFRQAENSIRRLFSQDASKKSWLNAGIFWLKEPITNTYSAAKGVVVELFAKPSSTGSAQFNSTWQTSSTHQSKGVLEIENVLQNDKIDYGKGKITKINVSANATTQNISSDSLINRNFSWLVESIAGICSGFVDYAKSGDLHQDGINYFNANLQQAYNRQMPQNRLYIIDHLNIMINFVKSYAGGLYSFSQRAENVAGFYDRVLGELSEEDINRLQDICKWTNNVHGCMQYFAEGLNDECNVKSGYSENSCSSESLKQIEEEIDIRKQYYNRQKEELYRESARSFFDQDGNIVLLTYLVGWYMRMKLKEEIKKDIHDEIELAAHEVLEAAKVYERISEAISHFGTPINISKDDVYNSTLGAMVINKNVQKNQIVEALLCALENLIEIKMEKDKSEEASNKIREFLETNSNVDVLGKIAEDVVGYCKSNFSEEEKRYHDELCTMLEKKNTSKSIYESNALTCAYNVRGNTSCIDASGPASKLCGVSITGNIC